MDALTAQCLSKLGLQQMIDTVQNEIDDFHRGVDNAQPLGHSWEGIAEELVIQFDNDLLLALR